MGNIRTWIWKSHGTLTLSRLCRVSLICFLIEFLIHTAVSTPDYILKTQKAPNDTKASASIYARMCIESLHVMLLGNICSADYGEVTRLVNVCAWILSRNKTGLLNESFKKINMDLDRTLDSAKLTSSKQTRKHQFCLISMKSQISISAMPLPIWKSGVMNPWLFPFIDLFLSLV